MTIAFIGIDVAKNVFQLHGVDVEGTAVFKKRVRREGLLAELADIPACRIGIEACTGAFWWQRQFGECPELCVSCPAHAGFRYGHALKRSANMIANWFLAANHSRTFLPPFSKFLIAR